MEVCKHSWGIYCPRVFLLYHSKLQQHQQLLLEETRSITQVHNARKLPLAAGGKVRLWSFKSKGMGNESGKRRGISLPKRHSNPKCMPTQTLRHYRNESKSVRIRRFIYIKVSTCSNYSTPRTSKRSSKCFSVPRSSLKIGPVWRSLITKKYNVIPLQALEQYYSG